MSDLNNVTLTGRLTKDCELKYGQSGAAICKGSIAVGDYYNGKTETSFFDFTIFGKMAEGLQVHLTKGKEIGITGKLKQSRWEKDGDKKSRVEILVSGIKLFSSGSKAQNHLTTEHIQQIVKDDFEDDIPF